MDTNVAGLNKVYCFTTNAGYNGKVVTITDGVNTWERTIDSLSCVFMIPSMPAPAKKRYTVVLHNGDATAASLYSRVIDLGFGDSVRIGLYTTDENADKAYVQSWVSSHAYSLPTASSGTKGGITVSDTTSNGLYMSGTGLYLRSASATQKGGIYVGNGLQASSGIVSVKPSSASGLGGIAVNSYGVYIDLAGNHLLDISDNGELCPSGEFGSLYFDLNGKSSLKILHEWCAFYQQNFAYSSTYNEAFFDTHRMTYMELKDSSGGIFGYAPVVQQIPYTEYVTIGYIATNSYTTDYYCSKARFHY